MTNTDDEFRKWVDVFQHAFKDITEEHRSAVRSLDAQQKALDRQSSAPATGRKSQFQGLGVRFSFIMTF